MDSENNMLIEIKDLKKVYGGRAVVEIPELLFHQGETIGLVGNNGAGKTTLFRMMLDLIRPAQGTILSKGKNVANSQHWKEYTTSYLDEGFLIDYLTPEEYFDFIGSLHDLTKPDVAERLRQFEEFFNGEILKKGKYIRDLSKGNKNKVGIVAALLHQPEILVLDEPFTSLDPTTQIRLKNLLKELKTKSLTSFISSHDLLHVTDVCDRIILIEKGVIIKDFQTTTDSLKELEEYFAN